MNISYKIVRKGEPFTALTDKHYGPALVHAINNTIERIQEDQRAKIPTRLRLRTAASQRLVRNLVSIDKDDFASTRQQRYTGRVSLKASLGASEGVRRFAPRIIRFEFGGVETSESGKPLYVPTSLLRPSIGGTIRRDMYPKALGVLEARGITGGETARFKMSKRGKVIIRGLRRTYAIDPRFHPGAAAVGVWQRRGKGIESEPFKLWNYVRSIRYPKRFSFQEDSNRIVAQHFVPTLKADLDKRVFRALGVGGK